MILIAGSGQGLVAGNDCEVSRQALLSGVAVLIYKAQD